MYFALTRHCTKIVIFIKQNKKTPVLGDVFFSLPVMKGDIRALAKRSRFSGSVPNLLKSRVLFIKARQHNVYLAYACSMVNAGLVSTYTCRLLPAWCNQFLSHFQAYIFQLFTFNMDTLKICIRHFGSPRKSIEEFI
jgi:hypothetical protein